MTLSSGQLIALRNLANKKAGEEVAWINIADARALTELGFAERSREGWLVTKEGLSALEAADANAPEGDGPDRADNNIISMRKETNEGK